MHYAVVHRRAKLTAQHRVIYAIPCKTIKYHAFSHHQQGRIDFNTVNPSLSTPCRKKEISWVSGNLSGVGDRFPNTSRVLVEYKHSLIINLPTVEWEWEWIRKSFPVQGCGQVRIDSVKINPSLLMMRECHCIAIVEENSHTGCLRQLVCLHSARIS